LAIEVERTVTLTSIGVGRPDYSPRVGTEKLATGPLQQRFIVGSEIYIEGLSTEWITLYTVPTGSKLELGSLIVNCNNSLLQRINLYYALGGTIYWLIRQINYDSAMKIVFGPESTIEVPAGGELVLVIHNEDVNGNYFIYAANGYLERVG